MPNGKTEDLSFQIATGFETQKNLHACSINTYRPRFSIWDGTSMDSLVWKDSWYQSDPATLIKSLSSEIGNGLANKTK